MARDLLRSLKTTYFTVDPRSLGLFRITLGLVLLWDVARRYEQLDFWYTNSGLLPNHTLLWRPPAGHMFSLFFAASTRSEATLLFAGCAVVYLLFLVGYRTRVMQVLAVVCRVSLNTRVAVLENGGDMVINLLCIFSVLLPLGRRFSIDAWIASLRDGRIGSVEALNDVGPPPIERKPIVSPAVFGLILQFAAIYFFNAAAKQGEAWLSGNAVHYALHQDKFVTSIGVWMRSHLPIEAVRVLTWSVLGAEWLGFALILTPIGVLYARLLAVTMLPLLHLSFALGLHLGNFSPAMMSFFPLLLLPRHWDAIGRFLERRGRPLEIELDYTDARALERARVLRELDRFARITFTPVSKPGFRVCGLPDGADRLAIARKLASALPWGFAWGPPLALPGVRRVWLWLGARAFAWSARTMQTNVPLASQPRSTPRVFGWVSNAAVSVLIVAIGLEIVNDNWTVPQWMRVERPAWAKMVIEYPRLLQGWRMFAPDPPVNDSMIYVDAKTAEGTRVDPYNAVASRQSFPAGDVVPERMDQSQFFTMYSDRIGIAGYAAYRQAFLEWLLAYPERTGRPVDCLASFDVYLITDQSPPPGSKGPPRPVHRERFMHYEAPADSSCAALQLSAAGPARPAITRHP